jgi:nitroreductase
MDFLEVLSTRRSIRGYTDRQVSREDVQDLLNKAVMAPSASNGQPWTFGIIQSPELLADLSTRTKAYLLAALPTMPSLEKYRGLFTKPDMDIFHGAGTLVMIIATSDRPNAAIDCALAAENLMLAAREKGLGSCWIGFASAYCSQPEVKNELGIPEEYRIVAPIVLGYPKGSFSVMTHKAPEILFWKD